MPYYVLTFNPAKKFREVCLNLIGREPDVVSVGGNAFTLEFTPELSPSELNALKNGLPRWVRDFYEFEKKDGTLREVL